MDILLRRCLPFHKKIMTQGINMPVTMQSLIKFMPGTYQSMSYTCRQYLKKSSNTSIVSQNGIGSFYKYDADRLDINFMVLYRTYAKKSKEKGGKKGQNKPKVELSGEELNEIINFNRYKNELEEVLSRLKQEYVDQLTLRTSFGAIDNLIIDTPDGKFPLLQLAQITKKNPMLYIVDLTMSPQYIKEVKTAITQSAMNLNPQQEKTTLFVPIPKVTREHRENLAKNAKTLCDKTKDKLRHIQTEYTKKLAKKQKGEHFSEDLVRNIKETMQFTLKEQIDKAEEIMKAKQKEILGT